MTNDPGQQFSSDDGLDRQQKAMGNVAQDEASEQPVPSDLDQLQTAMGSAAQSDEGETVLDGELLDDDVVDDELTDDELADELVIDDDEGDALPT